MTFQDLPKPWYEMTPSTVQCGSLREGGYISKECMHVEIITGTDCGRLRRRWKLHTSACGGWSCC